MNIKDLPKIQGKYKFNYNLSHLTWFKVGGAAQIFFTPRNCDDLVNFLKQKPDNLPIVTIGAGSNLIIRDGGIDGVVIRLGQEFATIEKIDKNHIAVGAGCLNYNLAKYAQRASIGGFEFLVGIPGTIGGGIAMNAGCYGTEFQDIIEYVEAVNLAGEKVVFSNQDMGFAYRHNKLSQQWIFTKAICRVEMAERESIDSKLQEISQQRTQTQPTGERTGGSSFANPLSHKAWKLIDEVGFRGRCFGGAKIAEQHCNFIINNGTAKASDIEHLGELVRQAVWQKFAIDLQWEIKIIGKEK